MTSRALHQVRVLVVERHAAYAKLLTILLEGAGAEVRSVATGEAALSELAAFQPRLVTVDLMLPGMNGLALIEKLRRDPRTHDAVIVAVTGLQDSAVEARVLACGGEALIRKPVSTDAFTDTLATILGGKP